MIKIGFVEMLQVLFIALKLLDKISWSWWMVWSPMWIAFIFIVGLVIIKMVTEEE